jgi:hypothetical protein
MKTFSPLGVASLLFSIENATEKLQIGPINVKTYQFKHSVKDDQIIRQKLQISILLILEMVLHVIWNGASVDSK